MSNRLASLDALRGVAAAMVFAQHAIERVAPHSALLSSCNIGRLGVLVFFLISGFVVPFSIKGERALQCFAINRAARLLPALWFSIGVSLVLFHDASAPTIAANLTLLALPLGMPLLAYEYWTLSYELGFYLVVAALYAAGMLRNARLIAMIIAFALGLALLGHIALLYGSYLLMGLLMRLALLEDDPIARRWVGACGMGLMVAGGLVGWLQVSGNPLLDGWPRMTANLLALPIFSAIILLRPQPPRALLWLGTISYSFYLMQTTVLELLEPLQPLGEVFYVVMALAVTVMASSIITVLVERPLMALGKQAIERLRAKPGARCEPQAAA